MKTAALFILPIAKRWGGGPLKAVEGPRGSAENAAMTAKGDFTRAKASAKSRRFPRTNFAALRRLTRRLCRRKHPLNDFGAINVRQRIVLSGATLIV
jgi:hypothetical protein